MFNKILPAFILSCFVFAGHGQTPDIYANNSPFIQETHIAFPVGTDSRANEVRDIAVDKNQNIWIATADGIFRKETDSGKWDKIILGEERGPAYAVTVEDDGSVLLGTWDGLYTYRDGRLKKEDGLKAPISVICGEKAGSYAIGPYGIWRKTAQGWKL